MNNSQADFQLIHMLSDRMEHISGDSIWAHRASGLRGALLRQIDMDERNIPSEAVNLRTLIAIAFRILDEAASRRIS